MAEPLLDGGSQQVRPQEGRMQIHLRIGHSGDTCYWSQTSIVYLIGQHMSCCVFDVNTYFSPVRCEQDKILRSHQQSSRLGKVAKFFFTGIRRRLTGNGTWSFPISYECRGSTNDYVLDFAMATRRLISHITSMYEISYARPSLPCPAVLLDTVIERECATFPRVGRDS